MEGRTERSAPYKTRGRQCKAAETSQDKAQPTHERVLTAKPHRRFAHPRGRAEERAARQASRRFGRRSEPNPFRVRSPQLFPPPCPRPHTYRLPVWLVVHPCQGSGAENPILSPTSGHHPTQQRIRIPGQPLTIQNSAYLPPSSTHTKNTWSISCRTPSDSATYVRLASAYCLIQLRRDASTAS